VKLSRTFHFNPLLINLVPLVNVVFLVVVFYALSSRFVLQPGLSISLPPSSFSLAPQLDPQIVSITAAPVPAIYFQDSKVTLEEFGSRLDASRRGRALIVKADANTPYALVMEIMNRSLAQGFSVVLATTPERP
jgi:biopolymer transport protein ExbD